MSRIDGDFKELRSERLQSRRLCDPASLLRFYSCNPCNPWFSFFGSCLLVLIRGWLYFLYAGASGNAGGSKPSSSSSSLLNARPDGVITRAVTKITRFRLMC